MAPSIVGRFMIIAIGWLAVTELRPSALAYGLVVVPLAVASTYLIIDPRRRGGFGGIRRAAAVSGAVLRFAGWVVTHAILGGLDVARRALWLPRPDIDPVWLTHRTRLTSTAGREALALALNLTPGTLSARLEGDEIDIHIITRELDVDAALAALETRIAAIERAVG